MYISGESSNAAHTCGSADVLSSPGSLIMRYCMPLPCTLGATMSPNGLGAAAMPVLQLCTPHSAKQAHRLGMANISAKPPAAGKKKRGEMMEKPTASLNKCNSTTGPRHNDPVLAGCIFSSFFLL